MKIALAAPTYPLKEAPSPPLGLCYVAAACESAGAEAKIFDYIVRKYSFEKLEAEMNEFRPDVIGATSVTMSFIPAARIIQDAKKINPEIITMMGGPHVSFDIENTLERYPELDLIIVGEGEATLAELIPVIKDRNAWKDIKGIAFRENGNIVFTGSRPMIEDLDTLPLPARHLLPLSRYQALGFPVSIITSRGCPNKCIFCLGRKMVGFRVRHRSPELVADEIEEIMSYGFDMINIADDLFTANKERVKAFCSVIKSRNLKFAWSIFSRVNTIDEELLEIMKDAGCIAVSFGIESGSQEMLKRVRKGITLDQARKAVEACRKTGMRSHASFMVGLPGENLETMEASSQFQKELDIEYGYHFLCPFPGTTVRENIAEYDLEILTDDWNRYDADSPVVKTSTLSPEQMETFVENSYREIREDWDRLKARHEKGETTDDEKIQIEGYRKMEFIFKVLSDDLLERHGCQIGEPGTAIERVISGIASETGESFQYTSDIISMIENMGLIRKNISENCTLVEWTHNNRDQKA